MNKSLNDVIEDNIVTRATKEPEIHTTPQGIKYTRHTVGSYPYIKVLNWGDPKEKES